MDPITHTLTGAAISRAGLRRTTPLATATLVLAANVPDIDVLAYFGGEYAALEYRRGWTHGPLAMAILPFLVAATILAYDRWVRRRRVPDAPPARGAPILGLSILGVLTHPLLDWMNTYGIRLLMPFDRSWYYGDALFIVDPWVWLLLGAAVFLAATWDRVAIVGWALLAGFATLLVLSVPVPTAAKGVWLAGLAAIVVARLMGVGARGAGQERAARLGLGLASLYIALMVTASTLASREVRAAMAERIDEPITAVMVAPEPANPFTGSVVVATSSAYRFGRFEWLGTPRFRLFDDTIPILPPDPVIDAAAATAEASHFLVWSRFPFFEVRETGDGYVVRIGDARYADEARAGALSGLTVRLDRELRPVTDHSDRGT